MANDWKEKIEAQIASIPSMVLELEDAGMFAMAERLRRVKRGYRKTLDVAVAAEQHTQSIEEGFAATVRPDIARMQLNRVLDKLRGVER